MLDFLNNMEPLQKGFWYVALFSSVLFILQSLLTLIGSGHDIDGTTADFNGDLDNSEAPFQLFSLRNLVNFLLGFGWTGVTFYGIIKSQVLLIIVATLVGAFFILIFFLIIKQLLKLSEDNTFKIQNLIHLPGQVYIPIPGNMVGVGRIQVSVKGAVHELDAMTRESDKLSSGTKVQVAEIKDNILIVQKLNS